MPSHEPLQNDLDGILPSVRLSIDCDAKNGVIFRYYMDEASSRDAKIDVTLAV